MPVNFLFKFIRIIVTVIVFATLITTLAFVTLGLFNAGLGFYYISSGKISEEYHPGLTFIHALESFLIALLFIVFGLGIAQLFLPTSDREKLHHLLPDWLDFKSFMELKLVLWETIMTSILVFIVSDMVKDETHKSIEVLILPGVLLLIAFSFFILKKSEK